MIQFRLPDLGENVTEGEVVKVLVREGDLIAPNQTVMELETEKALLEVPSPAGGRVTQVHVAPGRKLKVNEIVLTIDEAQAAMAKADAAPPPPIRQTPVMSAPQPAQQEKAKTPSAPAKPQTKPEPDVADGAGESGSSAEVVEIAAQEAGQAAPAAPSTRKLARELGVDLAQVKGSGPGGRISQEDVREHVRLRSAPAAPTTMRTMVSAEIPPLPDFTKWGEIQRKPLSNIRKRTMEQLTLSWRTIPHVTHVDEADVTDLEALRERHAANAAAKGGKLTATVFVMKAVVAALKAFPQFNASIDAASEELILKNYFHIGIAVDTEHGLLVPVMRDVDRKPLLNLSTELFLISERARQRKVTLDELRGGTFTITNLGGIGGTAFTPIINYPEVAILGLARYQKRLAFKGDRMETRLILPLCLSYDHRIIDGADAARFTRKIAAMLEDPALLLLEP